MGRFGHMTRMLATALATIRAPAHRRTLTILAYGVLGGATLALVLWLSFGSRTLTVAVGPLGGTDLRVAVALLQALQRERAPVRLKLVMTEGPAESAQTFDARRTDLAVIRTDIAIPERSATVAILRRELVTFIVNPAAKIESIRDLRGRRLGMIQPRPSSEAVLTQILAQHGMALADLELSNGSLAEISQEAQEGRLDAVFVVAPSTSRLVGTLLRAFPKAGEAEAGVLGVAAAEAIAESNPAYESAEIARGAYAGDPAVPDEALTTLAVTHRLVARRTLDEGAVSELTRLIASLRLSLVAATPAANAIELPDTEDRSAKLPVHPGTIAYIEGETKTFFERYGDWLYLGIMGASILGSIATAFYARVASRKPPVDVPGDLQQLSRLIGEARRAPDLAALDVIAGRAEALTDELFDAIANGEPDADRIAAIRFLIDQFRESDARRRAALAG